MTRVSTVYLIATRVCQSQPAKYDPTGGCAIRGTLKAAFTYQHEALYLRYGNDV